MQIEGLKVTDYIKTEGATDQGFGVGTSGIKDDNKPNSKIELRSISVDNAFYDNRGKMTDEDVEFINESSWYGRNLYGSEEELKKEVKNVPISKNCVSLVDCGNASLIPSDVIPISPARYSISAINLFLAHIAKFLIAVLFIFSPI